jgi:hypothetical protein
MAFHAACTDSAPGSAAWRAGVAEGLARTGGDHGERPAAGESAMRLAAPRTSRALRWSGVGWTCGSLARAIFELIEQLVETLGAVGQFGGAEEAALGVQADQVLERLVLDGDHRRVEHLLPLNIRSSSSCMGARR